MIAGGNVPFGLSGILDIAMPDDCHVHLRDGDALRFTVPATSRCYSCAIVMPNLAPSVATVEDAVGYRERILGHVPQGIPFEPLMTLYLTNRTRPADIETAMRNPHVHACKLYPAGATTNSDDGVADPSRLYPVFEALEKADMPILVHGEVTDPDIDIFDRERIFLDRHLVPVLDRFPALRIVLEHVTTADGVDFVLDAPATVAATITPLHLLYKRSDMLVGVIRPHLSWGV